MLSGRPGGRRRLTRYDDFVRLQWVIPCLHGRFLDLFLTERFKNSKRRIRLLLVRHGVVELENVPFPAFKFRFLELNGRARMQVAQAGQEIGQVVAPQ